MNQSFISKQDFAGGGLYMSWPPGKQHLLVQHSKTSIICLKINRFCLKTQADTVRIYSVLKETCFCLNMHTARCLIMAIAWRIVLTLTNVLFMLITTINVRYGRPGWFQLKVRFAVLIVGQNYSLLLGFSLAILSTSFAKLNCQDDQRNITAYYIQQRGQFKM